MRVGGMQGEVDDLYRDHGVQAVRLAYLLTGDRARAEDIVHDGFVRLLGRVRLIRDPQALRAYLNRTVVNLAKNDLRRRSVQRRFLETHGHESNGDVSWMPDVAERDELHHNLMELPYRQRAALVLRYCEDLTEAEVADALGTSTKAVRSLVGRGLATLRNGDGRNGDG